MPGIIDENGGGWVADQPHRWKMLGPPPLVWAGVWKPAHVGSPRPDRGDTWIRAPLDRLARSIALTAREGGANTGEKTSGLLVGLWLARATSHAYTAASVTVTPLIIHGDLMVPANGFRDSASHSPGCHIMLRFVR